MKNITLFVMYQEWCREEQVKPLGRARFNQRMEGNGHTRRPQKGYDSWDNLFTNNNMGFLGTM